MTALLIIIIKLKYNLPRATTIIIFFTLVSMLIDWKRNNFIGQKIGIFVLLLLSASIVLFYSNGSVEPENNSITEKDPPKEHILTNHTRPSINSEACIQVFDFKIAKVAVCDHSGY